MVSQSVEDLVRIGIQAVESQDFALADAVFEEVLQIQPDHRSAAFFYARSAVQRGDWSTVLWRWQSRVHAQGWTIDVAIGIGEAQRELGNHEAAAEVLMRALMEHCADPNLYPSLARLETVRGDHAKAVRWWQRYLEVHPDDVSALHGLGVSQLETGAFGAAVVSLAKALAGAPEDVWMRLQLARALTLAGQWGVARDMWTGLLRAGSAHPAFAQVYRGMMQHLRAARADPAADPARVPPAEELAAWEHLETMAVEERKQDLLF